MRKKMMISFQRRKKAKMKKMKQKQKIKKMNWNKFAPKTISYLVQNTGRESRRQRSIKKYCKNTDLCQVNGK